MRPSGTVTFLFTDIEGSTQLWEDDAETMREALAIHDAVLGAAVAAAGGWLFKHTGDGVCAAFGSARSAIDAAIAAQRSLSLPVRMGLSTGEAELRGDDYFGAVLNRTARVMQAGHGGQILVAATTATLIDGVELVELGEFCLRGVPGVHRLSQVRADGLRAEFPPLRAQRAVAAGNLPAPVSRLIGRADAVAEVAALVREQRVVTLTGVGGVGKTRLALEVAGVLAREFDDGAWLIELAAIGDPDSLAELVAATLGVIAKPGVTLAASVVDALVSRQLLLVLDNCEHVLAAVAALVDEIAARTPTVHVLATSREGLRSRSERLWAVPPLGTADGPDSPAVSLFVERAREVQAGFALEEDAERDAVAEVCSRLDGIPLAIELAAVRTISMSLTDIRDRLDDRFRLLSGGLRKVERHQTLRQAVSWSYDLLDDDEKELLRVASAFAGGFGLTAATVLYGGSDEYVVLDLLDSLVRKSLVTTDRAEGHTRYGMLETVRQFAEGELAEAGVAEEIRDRHARFYVRQAAELSAAMDSPAQRTAIDWVTAESANLRAAFRWACSHGDLAGAAVLAANVAVIASWLQWYEPVTWAEELLAGQERPDVPQLPQLYLAASFCTYVGRPSDAIRYSAAAKALAGDPRYDQSWADFTLFLEAVARLYCGRLDEYIAICRELAALGGRARVLGLAGLMFSLPAAGQTDEALALADEALAGARAHGVPMWIAFAMAGVGRALAKTDPNRALAVLREGLALARENHITYMERFLARDAAELETMHGCVADGLDLFEATIESFHRAGDVANLEISLGGLAGFFERARQLEVAATLYGIATRHASAGAVIGLTAVADRLRDQLGQTRFDELAGTGTEMPTIAAVRYARAEIDRARISSDT